MLGLIHAQVHNLQVDLRKNELISESLRSKLNASKATLQVLAPLRSLRPSRKKKALPALLLHHPRVLS